MKKKKKMTSVPVSTTTRRILKLRKKDESYDEFIQRLLISEAKSYGLTPLLAAESHFVERVMGSIDEDDVI